MVITKETRDQMAEVLGQATVSDKTARDILLICKAGVTAKEALNIRGIVNPCADTITDLKQKSEKFLLSSPELQELAGSAAKNFLQGKPVVGTYKDKDGNELESAVFPKASTISALIHEVGARSDPVKQQQGSQAINLFIDKVQVNQFQAPAPLDMVSQEDVSEGQVIECSNIKDLCPE